MFVDVFTELQEGHKILLTVYKLGEVNSEEDFRTLPQIPQFFLFKLLTALHLWHITVSENMSLTKRKRELSNISKLSF